MAEALDDESNWDEFRRERGGGSGVAITISE